jgi:hypothetical protein
MMTSLPSIASSEPSSAEEWYQWLSEREEEKCRLYLADHGDQLVADYNNEQGLTHDYEGREILELLQNAGDAAADAGIQGKVAIELHQDGIVVANTGLPFTSRGVNSLRTAHLSPKRLSQKLLVGEKGLGFRSILNWTHTPLISSGSLELVFSRRYTRQVFERLRDTSPILAANVSSYSKSQNELIVPTLVFPAFSPDGNVAEWLDTPGLREIHSLCAEYRDHGFDTAVGMPFRSEAAFRVAEAQLEELNPEFLLFVSSIAEITIRIAGHATERVWRKETKSNGQVTITANGKIRGHWQVHDFGHESVPKEFLDDEGREQAFQVVVAAPIDPLLQSRRNRLFTYFPTDIEIPLAVLCHATLRLEANRKHPTAGKANLFILQKLAEAIAKVAEEHTSKEDPWGGLRLLCASGEYPTELRRSGFAEALRTEAAKRQLVPCLDGEFRCPGEAFLLTGVADTWIPAQYFPELAKYPEKEENWNWLSGLKIPELKADEFARRLSGQALTEDERIALILGIIRNGLPKEFHLSELLIDSTGKRVEQGNRVFLSPGTDAPVLPDWVNLRFLSVSMREKLQTELSHTDLKELQQTLSAFGVVRSDRSTIVQRVVAEANRRFEEVPEAEATYRKELLYFLQTVFGEAAKPDGDSFKFPGETRMELRNQAGAYESVKNLYLAHGYGQAGSINQGLYGSWAPEKLVTSVEDLGITGSAEELAEFLKWLGVAEFPREIKTYRTHGEFRFYVLAALDYPARFGDDYTFNCPSEVEGFWVSEYQTLDGLEEFLDRSPAPAILGWLAADDRFANWERRSPSHCKLAARRSGAHSYRNYRGDAPSYISWKISHTAWLPNSTGRLLPPGDCLNALSRYELLFPRPADPLRSGDEKFGLQSSRELFLAWDRAGVLPGLERLEIDQIYEILLSMPEKSPDGAAAKLLSRWLLENADAGFGRHGSNYASFATKGRMWGKKGDHEGYFPVTELRYKDSDSFPEPILKQFAIVDLPSRRVGARQVERLFHIKSLADATISQSVTDFTKAPMSDHENARFQEVKPFLKRMRESQSSNSENLTALDRLDLILCDELVVLLSADGHESEIQVAAWESVLEGESLFVKVDRAGGATVSRSLLSNSIGVGLARLFRLKTGDAFANMCGCSPNERRLLLKQMYGEDALAGLISSDRAEEELRNLPIYEVPQVSPPSPPADESEMGDERAGSNEHSEAGNELETGKPSTPVGVEVIARPHTTKAPRAPRRIIVRRTPTSAGGKRSAHQITDGALCERLAFAFEEEQGRFPIAMDNITGAEGAGCDIFSFESEDHRSRFKAAEPRDMALVSRFIEVKGRGDARAKIDLRGNEFECARRESKRYFLYRLYESGTGDYSLTVLQDPLHQEDAVSHFVTVDLDAADARQCFDLSPASELPQGEPVPPDEALLELPPLDAASTPSLSTDH